MIFSQSFENIVFLMDLRYDILHLSVYLFKNVHKSWNINDIKFHMCTEK